MGDDEWVKEAMTDDTVVVDLLLRLFQAQPPPPKPVQAVLRLGWTVRQRRSKSAPRHGDSTTKKKAEPARASPTTPLSWSGGTSASGGALDGFEESSRLSKPTESSRSKVCCSDFSHFCSDSVSSCERGYDLGLTTTSDSVWISFCLTLFFANLRKCPCGSRIFTFIGFRKSQGWVMEPGKGNISHHHLSDFFYLLFAFIFFVNLHLYPSLHGDASWFPGLVPSFPSQPDRKFRMFAVQPRFLSSLFFLTSRWPDCPRISAFYFPIYFEKYFYQLFQRKLVTFIQRMKMEES